MGFLHYELEGKHKKRGRGRKRVIESSSNSSSGSSISSNSSNSSSNNSSSSESSSTPFFDELEMRTIKIIDVGYIAIIYFIFAIACSTLFDKTLGEWSEEVDSKKSINRLSLELIGIIWMIGVITYIVRNIVELIPSPLSYVPLSNPKRKFKHGDLKELTSAAFFTLIFLGTSYHFKNKLEYFYKRFSSSMKEKYEFLNY